MKLAIKYHATEYRRDRYGEFECQHATTTYETIEHCDEYQEAVTGISQPVYYTTVETCDDCDAVRYAGEEMWSDE